MISLVKKYLRKRFSGRLQSAVSSGLPFQHVFVHPCVINEQPYIVYPRGLKDASPEIFHKLTHYYQKQGYGLKEDQRSSTADNCRHDRRKLVPALLFSASMLFESSAHAEIEINLDNPASYQRQEIRLQIVNNNDVRSRIKKQVETIQDIKQTTTLESRYSTSIFEILQAHYEPKETDPAYVINDLKIISNYYSQFPEVISLLKTLSDRQWKLSYNEHDWMTTASGNIFEIEKAVIHFNTRSAAQLKLNNGCQENPVCIASPADALLHELLHTHSMLVNTDEFISQGGMNSTTYPYKHEYAVISKERNLYAGMSLLDRLKRPSRHAHTGRSIKAHCPTCIK